MLTVLGLANALRLVLAAILFSICFLLIWVVLAPTPTPAADAEKSQLVTLDYSARSCRDKSVLHRYIVDIDTNIEEAIALKGPYGCRALHEAEGPFILLQSTARIDRFCQIEPLGSGDPTWVLCSELKASNGKTRECE